MSEVEKSAVDEISIDPNSLYREEIFTDLKVATIRRLTPIRPDGIEDVSRAVIFVGQTTLLSHAGPVPVQCPIEATSLADALEKFPAALHQSIERMIEEAKELQRQEASRIVIPGRDTGGKITLG